MMLYQSSVRKPRGRLTVLVGQQLEAREPRAIVKLI